MAKNATLLKNSITNISPLKIKQSTKDFLLNYSKSLGSLTIGNKVEVYCKN